MIIKIIANRKEVNNYVFKDRLTTTSSIIKGQSFDLVTDLLNHTDPYKQEKYLHVINDDIHFSRYLFQYREDYPDTFENKRTDKKLNTPVQEKMSSSKTNTLNSNPKVPVQIDQAKDNIALPQTGNKSSFTAILGLALTSLAGLMGTTFRKKY